MDEPLDLSMQKQPLDLSIHRQTTREGPQDDQSTTQSSSRFTEDTDVPVNIGQTESSTTSYADALSSYSSMKTNENSGLGVFGYRNCSPKSVGSERAFRPTYIDSEIPDCSGYGLESGREQASVSDPEATHLQVDHTRQSSTSVCIPDDCQASSSSEKTFHKGGSVISTTDGLSAHRKVLKPENTILECYECYMLFTSVGNLSKHFKAHHPLKQPFKCRHCNSLFSRNSALIRHLRTHTREKPYQCDVCEAVYSQPYDLKIHKRRHTGDKPFHCEDCEKSFPSLGTFSHHNRNCHSGEKPHKCSTCDKSFTWPSQLTAHIKSHSGEKPHKCNTCDKSFTWPSQLTRHVRSHTGEKPHKCSTCYKSFRWSYQLTCHVKSHTDENPM